MANRNTQTKEFRLKVFKKSDTTLPIEVGDPCDLLLYEGSKRTVTLTGVSNGGRTLSWDLLPLATALVATSTNGTAGAALPGALTSTDGTAGAAGSLGALAAEAEHIGDDIRATHAANILAQAEAEKIGDDVRTVIANLNVADTGAGVRAEDVIAVDGAHSPAIPATSTHQNGPVEFDPVTNSN